MAYTDDVVRAKLSALNETQDSIVTVAQWILFHRRNADRIASVWLSKVKDAGVSKRLNLVYLVNEVVQQSKARKRDDFLIAFSPIIADATATAYRGATSEVQTKLKRVVEVWKQRQIFDPTILEAVDARINEIDKSRSSGKKALLGGSGINPFSGEGATPAELQPILPLQTATNKAYVAVTAATSSLDAEYDKLLAPDATVPPPAVYAARLSGLLKNLATASGAVAESIKARKALIEGLNKLLESNRASLITDEAKQEDVAAKQATAEAKKRSVEDDILKGLPGDTSQVDLEGSPGAKYGGGEDDDDRPQMEELTPPPVESFTPDRSPPPESNSNGPTSSIPATRTLDGGASGGMFKKRKLDNEPELVGGDAMADLDDDVAELLRSEGGGG